MVNKSVDVIVTSVHQTTAGKMIFGRLDERLEQSAPPLRQSAAAGAGRGDGSGGLGTAAPQIENPARLTESSSLERQPRPLFPESDAS